MERVHKIIMVLLIIAIVFSVVSVLLNFSLVNLEFKPINIKIPANVPEGDNDANIRLFVESKPGTG